jgi:hypothetical protein
LLLDLARRGINASRGVEEGKPDYAVNPETGLPVFRSGRPITIDDVRALEDER